MRKFTHLASLCLALIFFLFSLPNYLQAQNVAKLVVLSNGDTIPFLEYKPIGHNAAGNNRKYPLIVFLHGGGQRSDNTSLVKTPDKDVWDIEGYGPSGLVARGHKMNFTWNGQLDTFIVLSPMSRETIRTGPNAGDLVGDWATSYINLILNYAKNNLKIDTNRIYLTGMSFGGGGTFEFISAQAAHPKKLAAAAPVCAVEWQFEANGPQYVGEAKLPVWGFHAADDKVTKPYEGTVIPINAINNRVPTPAVKALKTIWPDGGHGIWTRVYNVDNSAYRYGYDGIINIYEWFLGQNKSLVVNTLPNASAGNDFNVAKSPGTATLNASGSTDAGTGSGIVRYVWKKISAPAGVSLSSITIDNALSANASTTARGLTTAGDYKFRLFVVDTRAAIDSDDVVIKAVDSVVNKPPVPNAGNDVTITLPVDSIRLFGSASDPDGTVASIKWEKIEGPSSYLIYPNDAAYHPIMKNLVAGVYRFRLKATDNNGAVAYDTAKVTVNAASNQPPVANAGADQTITLPVDSIRIIGSASDPDGTVASISWNYLDGPADYFIYPNKFALHPIMKDLEEGVYRFVLKVVDDNGAEDYDTVKITVVNPGNAAPVANAGADKTITLPVDSIRIFGSGTDADGTIAAFRWEYVDGPSSYDIFPNEYAWHPIMKNLEAGVYHFKLTVVDNDGAEDDDIVQITVISDNVPPVANAGLDKSITLPVDSVRLYGVASDPDGTVAAIKWEFLNGPSTPLIYPNDIALHPIMKNLQQGVYKFRFKVTDNDGAIDYDTAQVTVSSGGNVVLDEMSAEEMNEQQLKVSVYPNPVRHMLNVTLNSIETGRTTIGIYDVKGSLRKTELTQKGSRVFQRSIDISALASGMYYVQVTVNGKRHIMKFIRQ